MKGRPIDGGGFVTHGGDRGLADRVTAVAVYTARLSSDHETYGALASSVVLLHWL